MDTSKMIKAYCLKTKEKNVPMHDAVVTKTAKGGYMAGGHDGKGNKMAAILSEANALKAIADGVAKKGFQVGMNKPSRNLGLIHLSTLMIFQDHP